MHSIATALLIWRRGIAGVDLVALDDIGQCLEGGYGFY
jgi:hypothetical protein